MAIESVINSTTSNGDHISVRSSSLHHNVHLEISNTLNNSLDHGTSVSTQSSFRCSGCSQPILDQYVLRVAPDMEWHAECLRCADCSRTLDESCTCFLRQGQIYCKDDYTRLFGIKCARCRERFNRCDFVMRAKDLIYHVDCFRCTVCDRQLVLGDEYALRDGAVYCRAHHDQDDLDGGQHPGSSSHGRGMDRTDRGPDMNCPSPGPDRNLSPGREQIITNNNNIKLGCTDSESSTGSSSPILLRSSTAGLRESRLGVPHSGGGGSVRHSGFSCRGSSGGRHHSHGGKGEQKTTRIRTVLNEKQLHTLRTCYSANSRPDALMKEQLVEMTGLSPRVIRVWFQNKRCKDKKRSIALKQLQQQQQNKMDRYGDDSWIGQKGIPLIATSPVRLEPTPEIQSAVPVDVEKCPAPFWSSQHEDEDDFVGRDIGDVEPEAPFQQLINSFGDSFDDDSVVSFDDLSDGSSRTPYQSTHMQEQQQQQQQSNLNPLIHIEGLPIMPGLPRFAGLAHLPGIGHITNQTHYLI